MKFNMKYYVGSPPDQSEGKSAAWSYGGLAPLKKEGMTSRVEKEGKRGGKGRG